MQYRIREDMLCQDNLRAYGQYRKIGKGREETVERMLNDQWQELSDVDDGLSVILGIVSALSRKQELFDGMAQFARRVIQGFGTELDPENAEKVAAIQVLLENKELYGPEAYYKIKKPYQNDWQVGDTFVHPLSCPLSKKLGIEGWYAVLYKYSEYVDRYGNIQHWMCLAVCPPDKLPANGAELEALGFLPTMRCFERTGERLYYHVSITLSSKRDENRFGLTKIGTFPDVALPHGVSDESPWFGNPFISTIRKGTSWPFYEVDVCGLYRDVPKWLQ